MPEPASRRPARRALRALVWAQLLLGVACARVAAPPAPMPVLLDADQRDRAAALLRLEDRREFDESALRDAAVDVHPELRRRSALAVGRIGDPDGLALLTQLIEDPDTGVAATAAFALGLLGDTAAVPALAGWLAAQRRAAAPTVAAEAATALGALRVPAAATALEELLRSAAEAERPAPIAAALLATWRHPRPVDVAPILRWTTAADAELRWRAVYALVRRPEPRAAPRLLELGADPDGRVRALVARGLAQPVADSAGVAGEALALLLSLAADPDAPTAINALRSLGGYAEPAAVERLRAALAEGPAAAVAAAESLGRIGVAAAPAVPALRDFARDPAQPIGVREAALLALVDVEPLTAGSVADGLAAEPAWRARAAAARAWARLEPAPGDRVTARIRDADPRTAAIALRAASDALGDSLAPLRQLLIESLGAADVQQRAAALIGLERLADPATLPQLLDAYGRALRDADNDAALAALDALAALQARGVPAVRALASRFGRPDDYLVRERAAERFGELLPAQWGAARPIETGRSLQEYRSLVERFVAGPLAGEPLPTATVVTEAGGFVVRLFAADAPLTVASFLELAERGYFDGQVWPRVVPNFVIQGGDPRGDQTGGPGYALRDELNRHRYGRGTVGMALSGPDTGGSQFFVTHSAQPHLDGGYTVFGEVVEGMAVVDRVVAGERIETIRVGGQPSTMETPCHGPMDHGTRKYAR